MTKINMHLIQKKMQHQNKRNKAETLKSFSLFDLDYDLIEDFKRVEKHLGVGNVCKPIGVLNRPTGNE
jgi:hypothetical protein